MQYVERVNQEVARLGASFSSQKRVPFEVVADALTLKQLQAETVADFSHSLSPEDTRLLGSRIGGTLARVAVASYIAADAGGDIEYFGALSGAAQEDIEHQLAKQYKKIYKRSHYWVEDVDPFTVIHENDPLPAFSTVAMRTTVAEAKQAELTRADRLRAFGSYLNVFPGTFPSHSSPQPDYSLNDVTLTQAFGRNDIPDKELPRVESMRAAAADDEAAMVQLDALSFDPGESNRALAAVIAKQLQDQATVVEQIAQWEVVYALRQDFPEIYTRYRRFIHTLWPQGNFYPTYAVKADSIKVMDTIGAYNPIEFAHPDMMVRARAILGRLGVQADVLATDIPFDPKSVQAQVRGPLPWMIREAATRAEHVLFGRVSF